MKSYNYPLATGDLPAHVIGIMDYSIGDPAQADISGLITHWFGINSNQTWFTVDDFSGVEIGFNLATRQCINGSRLYPFLLVLANAAPRASETKDLEAAPFVVFKNKRGLTIFTTLNSKAEELEFLGLDQIEGPIHPVNIDIGGTQFRSALLPEFAARYCFSVFQQKMDSQSEIESLSEIVDLSVDLRDEAIEKLNEPRGIRVIHVDNFGNMKLSLTEDDKRITANVGDKLEIEIAGIVKSAVRGKHLGDLREKDFLCLYPGSSKNLDGKKFMEICLVGGSAAHVFANKSGVSRFSNRVRSGQEVTFF